MYKRLPLYYDIKSRNCCLKEKRDSLLRPNKKGTSYEVPFKMVDRTGLEPVTSCV